MIRNPNPSSLRRLIFSIETLVSPQTHHFLQKSTFTKTPKPKPTPKSPAIAGDSAAPAGKKGLSKRGNLRLRIDPISLGLVDADLIPKHERRRRAADGRILAKEHSPTLTRKHRAWRAAESRLRRLKDEVMTTQPAKLGAVAAVVDLSLPSPAIRSVDAVMPPLELYVERVKAAAVKKYGKKEKLHK